MGGGGAGLRRASDAAAACTVAAGTIRLSKKEKTPVRLLQVYAELTGLLTLHGPEVVAIEEVFFSANAKSALKLGAGARGGDAGGGRVAGCRWRSTLRCRSRAAWWGMGWRQKEQVQFMVTRLLELDRAPDSADAADALAIAICHIHTAQTVAILQGGAGR